MLEDLSWCQIHLYTQHANSNIADKKYEKNGANLRDLGFLTVDVTSSIFYKYDWVLMKKNVSKIANAVLSLLASGWPSVRARLLDSVEQRYDSQKSWKAKPLNGKQTWPTSCRPTTTTYVANHSGPLLLCTTGQKHWKFHYETQWYDWKRIFARRHCSERYVFDNFPQQHDIFAHFLKKDVQ